MTGAGFETLVVDPKDCVGDQSDWRRLAATALESNPFFGPDFLSPFLTHVGPSSVRLCVVRETAGGPWLIAAPVGRRRAGLVVPTATVWASEYGPLGAPLVAPGAPPQAVAAFLDLAAGAGGTPLVTIPYLPTEGAAARALATVADWHPVFDDPQERAAHDAGEQGQRQLLEAMTAKRRKELSRLSRRLADRGATRLVSHRGEAAADVFERFLVLEHAGWKGAHATSLLSDPATAAFARQMIAARAQAGSLRIDALMLDDRPLAMLVMLLEGARAFSWKIAYDEAFARFSPGQRVALFALETNLREPGLAGGDSLAVPGHPMISPLWRGRMVYATGLFARSPAGRLIRLAARLDLHAERQARRLARRLLRRG
ncbi:GNAT family N-acetyltransferase [Polymorphum gilvum]|uniref:BioF2-like acetyltransferase domain-containing protein n=1 Tax=Polymorphum gilvum (strain LMG 25793 / CGMCC 1.9160 / SL003B-26A1) TaxID=991905 RepID=F2J072_POLGS|nr:GNAT family N-acetyltransferase [Polymorphum gilvum]ADZ68607.1 hypothetical protein SL003B_0168 [Polymorphum gilvum SL003B-26A1]